MILYVFIILLIKFPNIMCDSCISHNNLSCQVFPKDDVDADLELQPDPENRVPCGQYGFRCLDEQTYEICELIEDRHSPCVFDLPVRRECDEGFICDEDNPAFCTPFNKTITAEVKYVACCLKSDNDYNNNDNDDDNYIDDSENLKSFDEDITDDDYELRNERDLCDNNNNNVQKVQYEEKCDNCNGPIYTTTDAPEVTTVTVETITELPAIADVDYDTVLCSAAGFYPDVKNNSNFWMCDINENGEGFVAVHMKCKEDEIFNKQFSACIIPGAIKQCRNINDDDNNINNINNEKTSFTCVGKNSGKYLDEDNCRYYHVCLNNKLSPIKELLFACPESTAFDPTIQKCTKKAISRCTTNNCQTKSIKQHRYFCKGTPSRFRQINDCKSYYLCVDNNDRAIKIKCPKGYKVDDNIMECLPKRIARCILTE